MKNYPVCKELTSCGQPLICRKTFQNLFFEKDYFEKNQQTPSKNHEKLGAFSCGGFLERGFMYMKV